MELSYLLIFNYHRNWIVPRLVITVLSTLLDFWIAKMCYDYFRIIRILTKCYDHNKHQSEFFSRKFTNLILELSNLGTSKWKFPNFFPGGNGFHWGIILGESKESINVFLHDSSDLRHRL